MVDLYTGTYLGALPLELIYIIVNKLPNSLGLYSAIRYFRLNPEIIFRTRISRLYPILNMYPLQIIYKGRSLSWQKIYEEYSHLEMVVNNISGTVARNKYSELAYVKHVYLIDIFGPYMTMFSGNRLEEIMLLVLYDYMRLLTRNLTLDIKLLEYEVFIDYVLRHPISTDTVYAKEITDVYLQRHYNILPFYDTDIAMSQDMLNFHIQSIPKISLDRLRLLFGRYYLDEYTGYIFDITPGRKYTVVAKLLVYEDALQKIEVPTWMLESKVSEKLRTPELGRLIGYGDFSSYILGKSKYRFRLI